jgi:hypothetical protein
MLLRSVLVSAVTLVCIRASAQSVISTHSGLVHFFEGAISIDGRAAPPINGRFPEVPEGALLQTNEGKAEILLGPEIFLWLGRTSTIRMQRNSLTDTRVELIEGSAIMQSAQLLPDNAVTLIHKNSHVKLSAHCLYRIDTLPSRLTVVQGQANVTNGGTTLVIKEPCHLAFSSGLITPLSEGEPDGLDRWAQERRRAIAAANLNRGRTETSADRTKNRPHRRGRAYPAVITPVPRRTW